MKGTIFKPVSIGEVAENLKLGSQTLEVWPRELVPTAEGELTTGEITLKTAGVNTDGDTYNASVDMSMTVRATWLGGGNVITAPNVRRGERVMLYSAGDSDKFYWRTMGMDQNLRRLETIIIAISSNPDNADQDSVSPENSYFIEFSTHEKLITLQTTMLNGEKAAYSVQLNLGDGTYTIADEKGNSFFHDSVNTLYRILNVDKTKFEMDKKVINMYAEDEINLETNAFNLIAHNTIDTLTKATTHVSSDTIDVLTKIFDMVAETSTTVTTSATTLTSSDTVAITTTDMTVDSSASFTGTTAAWTVNALATASIISPLITFDGVVIGSATGTFAGGVLAASLAAGGGAAPPAGGMDESGAITGASTEVQDVIAATGSFSNMLQATVINGTMVTASALQAPNTFPPSGSGPGFTGVAPVAGGSGGAGTPATAGGAGTSSSPGPADVAGGGGAGGGGGSSRTAITDDNSETPGTGGATGGDTGGDTGTGTGGGSGTGGDTGTGTGGGSGTGGDTGTGGATGGDTGSTPGNDVDGGTTLQVQSGSIPVASGAITFVDSNGNWDNGSIVRPSDVMRPPIYILDDSDGYKKLASSGYVSLDSNSHLNLGAVYLKKNGLLSNTPDSDFEYQVGTVFPDGQARKLLFAPSSIATFTYQLTGKEYILDAGYNISSSGVTVKDATGMQVLVPVYYVNNTLRIASMIDMSGWTLTVVVNR